MSRLASEYQSYLPSLRGGRGWGRAPLARRSGPSPAWLIAGLVVVAAGAVAYYVLAPDFQRYMKIRNM